MLLTERGAIAEAIDIARHAEAIGTGACLFPSGREDDIQRFEALAQEGLDAGRALALRRMLADEEALSEQVPKPLRGALGKTGIEIARKGVVRTLHKYGGDRASDVEHETVLRRVLDALGAALEETGTALTSATLLGAFSYADIAMAQVLAYVEPPSTGAFRIGRGSRRVYMTPGLKESYGHLLAWREGLYATHRGR